MLAARAGIAPAVSALIAHGANVNATEKWKGQTALMWAAAEGHVAAVQALVAAGADLNARSKGGLTPFLFAVRESQVGVVRALLAAGAKVDETIIGGPPPRVTNIGQGGGSSARKGPERADARGQQRPLRSRRDAAGRRCRPELRPAGMDRITRVVVGAQAGPGQQRPDSPGSGAMNSLDIVRRLVAKGANVNAEASGRRRESVMTHLNLNGGTPLFFAARTCDVEMMRLLVELGANPKLTNEDSVTPLMAAAGLGTRSTGEDAGTEPECVEAVSTRWSLVTTSSTREPTSPPMSAAKTIS